MGAQPEPRIATFESVIILATASSMTAATMEQMDRIHEGLKRSYPAGVTILILRDLNSEHAVRRGLDRYARERGAELLRKNGKTILGCAYVYDDGGFVSSVIRMAMAGMSMVSPFNAALFRTTGEAVPWICGLRGQPPIVRDGRAALLERAEGLAAELRLARAV